MSSKAKFGILLLAGGAVALGVFTLRQPSEQTMTAEVAREPSQALEPAPELSARESNAVENSDAHPAARPADKFQYSPGQDAAVFIEGMLVDARAGNSAAQYAIYEAMFYCDDTYKLYFERRSGRLTLDEALSQAAKRRGTDVGGLRTSHASCQASSRRTQPSMDRPRMASEGI